MTNEEILNNRWKNIDKELLTYQKNYKKVRRKTKDNIQNVFDTLNITYKDINKPISKREKDRLDRLISEYKEKGLLTGYFGYKARSIYSKKKVTYLEMLEIMLMGCYIEENNTLDEYNNLLFYEVCKDSYEQGIKDIEKVKKIKPISFKLPILYTILNIPIFNSTVEDYLYLLELTNSDELLKEVLINIQLGKELNIDSKLYEELLKKQDKRLISINDDKLSGGIVNIVENITNEAYLQAGIDSDIDKCRFVAEMDKRTTKMCESLNNQIFNVNGINKYQRYSEIDKKVVLYETKGLVLGENLPPINNHFHWCRSTITYQLDMNIANEVRNNIKIANNYDKEQYARYKKYFGNLVPDNVEDFVKMKYNNPDEWESLKRNYYLEKKRYEIKNNLINTKIREKKQGQHILNNKMYVEGKSYFTLKTDEVYKLINEAKGTGKLIKNNNNDYKEIIVANKEIGHFIDKNSGIDEITNTYIIIYSKDGIHSYPIKRR